MTPDIVAGVWLGFDQPKTITTSATGGSFAAPVWADMMKSVYQNRPDPGSWSAPESLVSASIDEETGMLASNNCPPLHVRVEYFVPGTQPTDYCPLHATGPQKALKKLVEGIRRIF